MQWKSWHGIVLAVCAVIFVGIFYRDYQLTEGRKAFERLGCPSCHMAGGAPSLAHVGRKYDRQMLVEWLTDPEAVYVRLGRRPLNPGFECMPRMQASHRDIEAISWFLAAQR